MREQSGCLYKSQLPNPNCLQLGFGSWSLVFRSCDLLMRRFDVNDDVNDSGELLHQPILDDVRQRMGFAERSAWIDPEMHLPYREYGSSRIR